MPVTTSSGRSEDPSVCAVLVTYRPEPDVLAAAVAAAAGQVAAVVIVDNGSPDPVRSDVAVVLRRDENLGLAAAQNAGIQWARGRGHSHVLLLDQDSVPAPDMVAELLAAEQRLSATHRVGAVGPRFRDEREDTDAPFVRVAFPMSEKLWCRDGAGEIRCDFLISSGCLIRMAVLDDVGEMDDGLFIDNVDLEWSFRARAAGYALFGVCAATMRHRLGDDRLPLVGGYQQIVHGPVRLYFIMRNRVSLYGLRHTPRVWIAQDLPRVLAKFLIFALLVTPRARNVRYMLRGLVDGVRRRTGPCPLKVQP